MDLSNNQSWWLQSLPLNIDLCTVWQGVLDFIRRKTLHVSYGTTGKADFHTDWEAEWRVRVRVARSPSTAAVSLTTNVVFRLVETAHQVMALGFEQTKELQFPRISSVVLLRPVVERPGALTWASKFSIR
jgi:hypothetical protein